MATTRTLHIALTSAAIAFAASACGTTSTSTTSPADIAAGNVANTEAGASVIAEPNVADDSATNPAPERSVIENDEPSDVNSPQADTEPPPLPPQSIESTPEAPEAPGPSAEDDPADPPQDDPSEPHEAAPTVFREVVDFGVALDLSVLKLNPDTDRPDDATPIDPALNLATLYPLPDFGLTYEPAAEPPCGVFAAIAGTATTTASVQIDALGDGTADDTVTSYYDGSWHIRLVTSSGDTSDLTIGGVGAGVVRALGAMSVDNDAAEQLLAIVGSGASAVNLGVFGADADGCLFRFTHSDDSEIGLSVGATTGWRQGVQCTDGSLISYGANNDGPDLWTTWGVGYERVSTTHLDIGLNDVGSSDTASLGDYILDCPGLTL